MFSAYHWLPLLDGRTGYPPPDYARRMDTPARLPDPAALAALRAEPAVRWVLVHCADPLPEKSRVRSTIRHRSR